MKARFYWYLEKKVGPPLKILSGSAHVEPGHFTCDESDCIVAKLKHYFTHHFGCFCFFSISEAIECGH